MVLKSQLKEKPIFNEEINMKNTIICIGRQYGSGGREIGEKLARRLGVTCYDKLLIKKAAEESGLSENMVSIEEETPVGFGTAVSGNTFADIAAIGSYYSEEERVFEAESKVISEIAKKGPCVIIGRCASSILREEGFDVLSVFVYAKKENRAKRIAKRCDIDLKSAEKKAEKTDRLRKKYFDFYSDTSWGSPESYDLMISSDKYGIDGTVDVIAKAVRDDIGGSANE